MSAFGSVLEVYAGVETKALAGELAAPATWAATGDDDAASDVPVVLDEVPAIPLSVWLMDISWSSWFRDTIWPTISVGSTGDVGS